MEKKCKKRLLGSGSRGTRLLSGVSSTRPTTFKKGKDISHISASHAGRQRRNPRHACEERDREGGRSNSRLLFHLLRRTEEKLFGRVQTHLEPSSIKSSHCLSKVQDGDKFLNPRERLTGMLDGQFGSQRRILSRAHSAIPQAISSVCLRRPSISVQGASLRPNFCSQGVHQGSSSSGSIDTPTRHPILSVPRRLSSRGRVGRVAFESHRHSLRHSPSGRFPHKPAEVPSYSDTGPCIFGYAPSHRLRLSSSLSREDPNATPVCQSIQTSSSSHRLVVPEAVRSHGRLPHFSPERTSSDATCTDVPSRSLEPSLPESADPYFCGLESPVVPQAVERPPALGERGSLPTWPIFHNSDHRRVESRLGGPLRESEGSGILEQKGQLPSHKLFGNAGRSSVLPSLPTLDRGSDSSSSYGQHFSPSLCQQGGRHKVQEAVLSSPPILDLVPFSQGCSDSSPSRRREEHSSGLAVSQLPVASGMGTRPLGRPVPVPSVGPALDGPVCHGYQQTNSSLLQLASGSRRILGRGSFDAMEVAVRVRFSSIGTNTEGITEGQEGELGVNTNRSQLAKPSMVSASTQYVDRPSSPFAHRPNAAHPTVGDPPTSKSGSLVPGSVEDKRRYLETQGLSPEVAQTIIASRSKGTYSRYESCWKSFVSWCKRKNFNPFETSVSQILDYLQHCLTGLNQAHSTIRGKVYAIALYHRQFPLERLSCHEWVKAFLKGAKRFCPTLKNILPVWDLQLVLQALRGRPFEPMLSGRLKWLTLKVVFLVAICTAKRIGELQALSAADRYIKLSADGVTLHLNPAFIPKVNKAANRELETFLVPFCPRKPGSQSKNTLYTLCPCRAIRKYIDATRLIRKTDQLFVCYGGDRAGYAASKMTIARWIRTCIEKAYASVGRPLPTGLKAHQTRSIAASWALFNNTSIADICKTATWSDECTFARHYKLNLAGQSATAKFASNVLQTVLDRRTN